VIIVLIGPPGSGKGTQGRLLAEKLNLPHISTGDMFRESIKFGDEQGLLVKKYMEEGKLVPAILVNQIVQKSLSQDLYKDGCILDGYPRNLEQVEFLKKFITQDIKVIFFDIDDQVVIERVLGRFNCPNCGQIYNNFIKPKINNICDNCGNNKFVYRKDDDKQTIIQRLKDYKIETYPVIDYYKNDPNIKFSAINVNEAEIGSVLEKLLKMI
jgi:adenylate kinase